jgi:ABC-type Mn/Zn transport systems, ATPase component
MNLIRCNHAALAYENKIVISDLDFEVNESDYLCIVGENGSGKSTLMKGLLGLKEPVSGEIVLSAELTRKEIGYLPQQTEVQKDFPASVYEVVLSGRLNSCGLRPFFNLTDRKIAQKNMEKLGISDLKKKCYRELSGGQQQRVLLARALCATKKLLILDEPVSGLDPIVTNELYQLIDKINKEEKITIIMVSHDIQSAVKYASHILHLKGKQLYFGTKEKYRSSEMANLFLGGV